MGQSPIGVLLVALASLSVATGSYLISSFYYDLNTFDWRVLLTSGRGLALFAGYSINLFGSIFWILGRRSLGAYLFSWNLYMGLLIVFGAIIASYVDRYPITMAQYFGIVLMVLALALLKR